MNPAHARILRVDDDPEDQMMVRRILRRVRGLDYEIDVLSSFEEAVQAIEGREHDLEAVRLGDSDYPEKPRLSASASQRAILRARERARAVRSLRASEERYALALEGPTTASGTGISNVARCTSRHVGGS